MLNRAEKKAIVALVVICGTGLALFAVFGVLGVFG